MVVGGQHGNAGLQPQAIRIGSFFMLCLACAAEFHNECFIPADDGYCCCENFLPTVGLIEPKQRFKDPDEMKDPISTGRKRAAIAKPISEGMVCEWAHLKFAGGGVEPIVGCNNNSASNIHHGPDKDILNNSDSNLHRICAFCHNRWHAKNDKYYGQRPTPGSPFIPVPPYDNLEHDPDSKASLEEVFKSEMEWAGVKFNNMEVDDYV